MCRREKEKKIEKTLKCKQKKFLDFFRFEKKFKRFARLKVSLMLSTSITVVVQAKNKTGK